MGALLTDLESVRQYLQERTDIDPGQVDDMEVVIEQVSDAIPRYCGRDFAPRAAVTRSFEFLPNGLLRPQTVDFIRYEARTVTKVVLDPELSGGIELAAGEWRLWPYPETREGTFYGLRLADTVPRPSQRLTFPTRRMDVTGDWGMAAVPELIRRYANETVAMWLEMPKDGREFNAGMPEGEAPAPGDDLPPSVRKGLWKTFMRPQFPR